MPETYLLQIKFIKFFAWEEQWIKNIIDARKVELQWFRKCKFIILLSFLDYICVYTARNINICYSLLWLLVPIVISVTSFFTFVITGHQLSVSVAFTVCPCPASSANSS